MGHVNSIAVKRLDSSSSTTSWGPELDKYKYRAAVAMARVSKSSSAILHSSPIDPYISPTHFIAYGELVFRKRASVHVC